MLIDLPEGIEKVERVETNTVGQLNSELYGLPESVRRFYELLKNTLKNKMNFEALESEPFIVKKGSLIIVFHVDDIVMVVNSK